MATAPIPGGPAPRSRAARGGGDSGFEWDLQAVLGRAVREVAGATGSARVAAWGWDAAGAPKLLAARIDGAALRHPDAAALDAVTALEGPRDLGGPSVPDALRRVVEDHGFSAAAPVARGEEGCFGALLLGGEGDPAGRVRPRTLAALDSAARRLVGPVGAVAAAQRLQRLDAEVRRLDRLAALGSLVAEIVHEIRNPLVSVKTFLQLLPERMHEPEFREGFLSVASEELRRVERLLDLVLQHGRPPAPSRAGAEARLDAVLESLGQLVAFRADERGVRLALEGTPALPATAVADDVLRQMLLNLTLNAIEVTPVGGTVRISARERAPGSLEIAVDDEGPGIPEAVRARLFEPFFSTKQERPGGLGLSITRRLAEEAGGQLAVRPREPRGSSFRLTLPAAPDRPPPRDE